MLQMLKVQGLDLWEHLGYLDGPGLSVPVLVLVTPLTGQRALLPLPAALPPPPSPLHPAGVRGETVAESRPSFPSPQKPMTGDIVIIQQHKLFVP